MEKLFKKLDLIKEKFENLEKNIECELKTGEKENVLSSIKELESLMDEARQIERGFLQPAPLPLSVKIFDEIKEAKKALGITPPSII